MLSPQEEKDLKEAQAMFDIALPMCRKKLEAGGTFSNMDMQGVIASLMITNVRLKIIELKLAFISLPEVE